MKKRLLSLALCLALCLGLFPFGALATGGGIYVPPGGPTEGGGGTYIPGEDTRTEIWCVSKPDSIGRSYDGTTDGGRIPINLTFTDGTNEIEFKEGTDFSAVKTFDSADAGWHTVTVEITLIGEAAAKYKLKAGEEKFEIGGNINKAHPDLTVSLSKAACTVGEKILPLLSVEGAPEDAEVTYYYLAAEFKNWAGSSDAEGGTSMPAIDGNTAISEPGTYYVYAKTGGTKNYEEERSTTAELTVNEAVVEAASVTKADGTVSGTYKTLPAALNAAQDGDTVKLLADHVTDVDALTALGEDFTFEQYASIVPVVTKTLTLDLNHKTVDYLEVGFTETNEKTQKKETLATGNLTVTSEAAYGRISNLMFMAGALDIRSGEIGGSGCAGLFCDANSGSVTVSNGTVYGLTVSEGASVTVNGGSNHAGEWVVASGATLNITDGTFGDVQFTHNGTIAISGGTFKSIKSYIAEELQPLMSLLADGYAFYGKDADEKYTVLQNSSKTTLENVKVLEHTEHSFLNGACIACGALTCDKSNNGEEGGCIAHVTILHYTWHIKTLGQIAYHLSAVGQWSSNYPTVTVEFLSDVTTDTSFRIEQCLTYATLDLDGHTISGELSGSPVAEVNYLYGVHCVIIQNGTIENTAENGTALQLSSGATTLENVDVKGDLALTYTFASSANYTPTFLGGGSFTKICALPDGSWQKTLEYMLPKGYYFADITTHKRVSQDALTIEDPLVNVTVLPCEHKDENGKSTFTVKHDRDDYFYCSICDNICPHESMTPNADGSMHCNDCTLDLAATATTKRGVTIYYIKLSDAFNSSTTGALLKPLHDQICTQLLLIYNGGYTIDLNGCTVTTQSESAPYIPDYTVTFQNSAEKPGSFVCNYIDVYGGGTLAVPAENNNLTISSVLFKQTGNGKLAGGSFGKITVESGKTLASLLVSGYCFTDSKSGKGAALYDADGNALTELTNVTVRLCSHDEAVYGSGGTWVCPCGQKTFVASITKGEATTYYTDLQEAFSAADASDTVKLLAAASGTANINKVFALDLNGYGAEEINVSAKATIKDSGETKGMIGKLTVSADGLTIGDLLEMGYAFKYENGNWMSNDRVTEGSSIAIHLAPIASVTLRAKDADGEEVSTTMPYGTTGAVRLDAACGQPYGATQATCVITKIEGGTMTSVSNFPGYTLPDDLTAGEHTYRVTFTSDGYSKSAEITITVTPVSLAGAIVAVGDLTYNGDAQTPEVTVTLDKKVLTKDKDYTLTGAEQTNAGSYHLTVTGKGGYEGEIGNVDWKIEPKTVTNPTINVAPCVYNGFEQTPRVELKDGERGIPEGEYTVAYSNNINAGDGSLTIQDAAGGNYVVSGSTTFPIEQASINTSNRWIEVRVFNELAKTYEVELQPNLDNILYEQRIDGTFGTVTYSLDEDGASTYADYYELGTAKIENGKLILPIKNGSGVPSGNYIVTLMLRVESTNFKSFDLPVHIIARDKIVPRLAEGSTVSATDITYGQTLADSMLTVTGSMEAPSFDAPGTIQEVTGTFAWTDGTVRPDAGDYEAEWTFTPAAGYEEYAPATGTVTIKVNKATPTFIAPTAQENLTYTGQEQALITAGSVTNYGTMQYSLTENGTYSQAIPAGTDAGTYTVWYRVIGDANHNDTAPASVAVRIGKKPLTITGVTAASKPYDGTTNADISSVTFDNVTLNRGTDYTVTASFDDASVGNGKNITATVSLMEQAARNYALEQSSFLTTGSITKAAPTYTPPTANDLTYNGTAQELFKAGTTQDGTMLYSMSKTSDFLPNVPLIRKAGTYTFYYQVRGDGNHTDSDIGTITVTIKKAPLTITAKDKSAYVGSTAPDLSNPELNKDYTVSGLFGRDQLTKSPVLSYATEKPDMSQIGSVDINISDADAGRNYTITYVSGKLNITTRSSSSGSSNSGTKTDTVKNPDGSTTKTETKADGSKTETTTASSDGGSTGTTVTKTDAKGNTTTEASAKLSDRDVKEAQEKGKAVTVPVKEIEAAKDANAAAKIKIDVPNNADKTTVEIPVENVTSGTVAVIVHEDGTEELVKDSKPTEGGVQLELSGSTTVKIIDNSKTFDDTKDHWSRDEVNFVAARELFNGVGGNQFGVSEPMTRGMVNTVLARLAGVDTTPSQGQAWYEVGTDWAKKNGISDGTDPTAPVTREQLATLLYRYAGSPSVSGTLHAADAASVSDYAKDALLWANQNGIVNGVGSNTIAPKDNAQRAQVAAMLARYLQNQ